MFGKILKITYYVSVIAVIVVTLVFYFQVKQYASANEFATTDVGAFVKDFYDWALKICIGLAVVMLMYAGYLYVTSAGNTDQNNRAKEYIVGTLSGLVFLILASLVYNTLESKSTPVQATNTKTQQESQNSNTATPIKKTEEECEKEYKECLETVVEPKYKSACDSQKQRCLESIK